MMLKRATLLVIAVLVAGHFVQASVIPDPPEKHTVGGSHDGKFSVVATNDGTKVGAVKNWDLGRMIVVNGHTARHPLDYSPTAYIPFNHRNGTDEILGHEARVRLNIEKDADDHDHDPYLGYKGQTKRKFVWPKGSSHLWPKGIVLYKFASGSRAFKRSTSQDIVRRAMAWYSDHSCIVWKLKTSQSVQEAGHDHYVEIGTGGGCAAYLGRGTRSKPVRELYLNEAYCMDFSTVLHEMGHSLGMHHEQSRDDRDDYVTMQWQYIPEPEGSSVNWGKVRTDNYAPYDLGSNMHYSLYAGSKARGKMTMIPKDADLTFLATTRRPGVMSFYDMEAVNYGYGCADKCNPKPACENGGYVNHNCVCVCPEKLSGPLCQNVDTGSGCGGVITLSRGQSENIFSPNFPNDFDIGADCGWLIKGPVGSFIEFDLDVFDIPPAQRNECSNRLEVRYNLIGQPGPQYCGKDWDRGTFNTTKDRPSNVMMIRFEAPHSGTVGKGFSGRVSVRGFGSPCDPNPCQNGGTCTVDSGTAKCLCAIGFSGDRCQNSDNAGCTGNPCQNGGTCYIDNNGDEKCTCPDHVYGDYCNLDGCVSSPCHNGGTCTQTKARAVNCHCRIGYSGKFCQKSNTGNADVIECDFDPIRKCPLTQDRKAALRWYTRRIATTTKNTGPSGGVGGGRYGYMEASLGKQGDTARLFTEPLTGAEFRCVTFHYHMYGKRMGKLTVNAHIHGADMVLWSREGNQGNKWHFASITLRATAPFQLLFEATRGSGSTSDIALDELKITPTQCALPTDRPTTPAITTTTMPQTTPVASTTSTQPPNPTTQPPMSTNEPFTQTASPSTQGTPPTPTPTTSFTHLSCSFDDGSMCQFTHLPLAFKWALNKGASPSPRTGPNNDHSGSGHYLLMEASEPQVHGDKAEVLSRPLHYPSCTTLCLSFWYHSNGRTPSTLSVYMMWQQIAERTVVWTSDGTTANGWRHVAVTVGYLGTFQVGFVGEVNQWQGDLGLDDISITDTECPQRP